jgi:multiple sugar transport system substrate-binding protein
MRTRQLNGGRAFLAAVAVIALAGCSSGSSTPAAASPAGASTAASAAAASPAGASTAPASAAACANGVVTVQFWHRGNPTPDAIKVWNQENPCIQVVVTPFGPDSGAVAKLASAVRAGNPPDLVDVDDINGPFFGLTGVLTDITDRVNALPFKDQLAPGHADLSQVNGKWFALPYLNGPSMLMWNKKLFTQAGLDPNKAPTTWAEIQADALKIRALGSDIYGFKIPGACGGCTVYTISPMIWASGGTILSTFGPDQTTTLATQHVADAFTWYRDMWKSGAVAPADQTEDGSSWAAGFNAGKVGIWIGYADNTPDASKAGVDVGMGPIPGKDGGYSTFEGGDILGIPAGSGHVNEAWQVAQWLVSPQAQEILASALVPVRLDMASPTFSQNHPYIAIALDATKHGQAPKSLAFNAAFEDPSAPWLQAFQAIVFNNADPMSTLAKADQEGVKLIKEAYTTIGQ